VTLAATSLLVLNLACDTTGQIAFKAAAAGAEDVTGFRRWRALLAGRWLWVGVICFCVEFVVWLAFISMVPLSLAILVGSADIVTVMIGGHLRFGEAVTRERALAAGLIVAGVVLVGWS